MTFAVCSGNEKQSGSLRAYTSFTILCKNINVFSFQLYFADIFFLDDSTDKFQDTKDFFTGKTNVAGEPQFLIVLQCCA